MNLTLVKTCPRSGTARQKSALPPRWPITLRLLSGPFCVFLFLPLFFLHTIRRRQSRKYAGKSPPPLPSIINTAPLCSPLLTQIQQLHCVTRVADAAAACVGGCRPHSVAKATSEIRREKRGKCDGRRGGALEAPPVSQSEARKQRGGGSDGNGKVVYKTGGSVSAIVRALCWRPPSISGLSGFRGRRRAASEAVRDGGAGARLRIPAAAAAAAGPVVPHAHPPSWREEEEKCLSDSLRETVCPIRPFYAFLARRRRHDRICRNGG